MLLHYKQIVPILIIFGLSSCTFLPSNGPSSYKIRHEAGDTQGTKLFYELVKVDEQTTRALSDTNDATPCINLSARDMDSDLFKLRGVEAFGAGDAQSIHPGDLLSIVIFEAGGGLYSPLIASSGGGTPATVLPPQRVDSQGKINIPYAGTVSAIGRLPSELEGDIKQLLVGKTIDPQVIVTISAREGGNLVTVGGDVSKPTFVPVTLAGTRLVDAITAAGGSAARPHMVLVAVTRQKTTRFDTLQSIYDTPAKNIFLQPGDTVMLRHVPLTCMIFGAAGAVVNLPIDVEDLSLAHIMSRAGGASDMRANPAGVFLYRKENREVLARLGRKNLSNSTQVVPVIYQIEMNKPQSFFLASEFKIRDGDILYYSTAGLVGLGKFSTLVNSLVSPAANASYNGARAMQLFAPGALP